MWKNKLGVYMYTGYSVSSWTGAVNLTEYPEGVNNALAVKSEETRETSL